MSVPLSQGCVLTFDLDDTLVPESVYARSGFAYVGRWFRETYGIDGFGSVAISLYDAGRRDKVFNAALEAMGLGSRTGEIVPLMVAQYRGHEPDMDLDAPVRSLLESLRRKAHLALITDGYAEGQRAKIRALGLDELFDYVIVTDELGREYWKPHKRAFEIVQAHFGLSEASKHVYVADNPAKDFIAPKALGWHTVRLCLPGSLHGTETAQPGLDAEARIGSLAQLAETLRTLGLPV